MTARGVIIPVSNFRCAHDIFILVGFVVHTHTHTVHGSPVSGMLQRPVHDGGALYRGPPPWCRPVADAMPVPCIPPPPTGQFPVCAPCIRKRGTCQSNASSFNGRNNSSNRTNGDVFRPNRKSSVLRPSSEQTSRLRTTTIRFARDLFSVALRLSNLKTLNFRRRPYRVITYDG